MGGWGTRPAWCRVNRELELELPENAFAGAAGVAATL